VNKVQGRGTWVIAFFMCKQQEQIGNNDKGWKLMLVNVSEISLVNG